MSEVRYVVRAKIEKDAPNRISRAGDVVWLKYEEAGGGWFQWSATIEDPWGGPQPFKSVAAAERAARDCPGPWYNIPLPSTIEVIECRYTPAAPAKLEIPGVP